MAAGVNRKGMLARRMLRQLLLMLAMASGIANASAAHAKNVALLIGNSDYENASDLANPANDVQLVAGALESIGFTPVVVDTDLSKEAMDGALRQFADLAKGADVALVYFAGHGVEVSGENYLIPVSAPRRSLTNIAEVGIRLDDFIAATKQAALRIVILDACRNNPYLRHLAGPDQRALADLGLGDVQTDGETLVVFATKAGSVAEDGAGRNSPFALAFAQRVIEPGVEVRYMLGNVRDDVLRATDSYQEPFIYGSLSSRERFLAGTASLPRSMTVSPRQEDVEKIYWQGALNTGTRSAYESYLFLYPDGAFAEQARSSIAEIASAPTIIETSEFLDFCRSATEDRYPFEKNATAGAALPDMLRLFSEREGAFSLKDAERSLSSVQYQRYLALNKIFTQGVRIDIALTDLGEDYDMAEFSASGTAYRWRKGEQETVPFFWTPFGTPDAFVRLYRDGQVVRETKMDGSWALFRLIDGSWLRSLGPDTLSAGFFGMKSAVEFRLTFAKRLNPFLVRDAWELQCRSVEPESYPADEFGDRG